MIEGMGLVQILFLDELMRRHNTLNFDSLLSILQESLKPLKHITHDSINLKLGHQWMSLWMPFGARGFIFVQERL